MPTITKNLSSGKQVYIISSLSFYCGDSYHYGRDYTYINSKQSETEELLFLIKSLNLVTVYNEKEKIILKKDGTIDKRYTFNDGFSFSYKVNTDYISKFIFKLCRYTRSTEMFKIIQIANEAIRTGVQPHNALVMAHYGNNFQCYYNGNDIVNILINCGGFSNEKTFKERFTKPYYIINNIYLHNTNIYKNVLIKYLKNKEYLEAEKYIC